MIHPFKILFHSSIFKDDISIVFIIYTEITYFISFKSYIVKYKFPLYLT